MKGVLLKRLALDTGYMAFHFSVILAKLVTLCERIDLHFPTCFYAKRMVAIQFLTDFPSLFLVTKAYTCKMITQKVCNWTCAECWVELDMARITSPCMEVVQNLFRRHTASRSFIAKLYFLTDVIILINTILSEKQGSWKLLSIVSLQHCYSVDLHLNHYLKHWKRCGRHRDQIFLALSKNPLSCIII